jgi:hypothetical protein
MKIRTLLVFALFIVSLRSFGKGGTGTNQFIFTAAEQGDVPLLQQIFATNLNAYALRDDLLRTAAIDGQKDAVDFLIDKGADPNAKVFSTGLLSTMAMYGTPDDDKHVEVATAGTRREPGCYTQRNLLQSPAHRGAQPASGYGQTAFGFQSADRH